MGRADTRFRVIIIMLALLLIGCGVSPDKPSLLAAEDVLTKLKGVGLPIGRIEVYTPETDPEHRLGRPGQYVEKVAFEDARYNRIDSLTKRAVQEVLLEELGVSGLVGGIIEVFDSKESLEKRKGLLKLAYEGNPLFFEYIYVHKNVILRLDQEVIPEHAEAYKRALQGL